MAKKWTTERLAELQELYKHTDNVDRLAKDYGLKPGSLRRLCWYNGFKRDVPARNWTAWQLDLLVEKWPGTKYPRLLAAEIGKPLSALRHMALKLGLKRKVRGYRCKGLKGYKL